MTQRPGAAYRALFGGAENTDVHQAMAPEPAIPLKKPAKACPPDMPQGETRPAKAMTPFGVDKTRETFESSDEAAKYMTDVAERAGIAEELWAPIYRDSAGKFHIGAINKSDSPSGGITDFNPPAGMSVAGDWHSHPTQSKYQQYFSPDDFRYVPSDYGPDFKRYMGSITHDRHGYGTSTTWAMDRSDKGLPTVDYCDPSTGQTQRARVYRGKRIP
jgi:hypothetical protein